MNEIQKYQYSAHSEGQWLAIGATFAGLIALGIALVNGLPSDTINETSKAIQSTPDILTTLRNWLAAEPRH